MVVAVFKFNYVWSQYSRGGKIRFILMMLVLFPISIVYGIYPFYKRVIEQICTVDTDDWKDEKGNWKE